MKPLLFKRFFILKPQGLLPSREKSYSHSPTHRMFNNLFKLSRAHPEPTINVELFSFDLFQSESVINSIVNTIFQWSLTIDSNHHFSDLSHIWLLSVKSVLLRYVSLSKFPSCYNISLSESPPKGPIFLLIVMLESEWCQKELFSDRIPCMLRWIHVRIKRLPNKTYFLYFSFLLYITWCTYDSTTCWCSPLWCVRYRLTL